MIPNATRFLSLFLLVCLPSPIFAAISMEIQDSEAAPGSSGFFDVFVSNSDALGVDIGGFSFELLIGGASGVSFTSVATTPTTEPYIFAGTGAVDVLGANFSDDAFPNTSFVAKDLAILVLGATLDPNETLSLGRVTYDLDPTVSPGTVIPVTFGSFTDLSDPFTLPIAFSTDNGAITAASSTSTVPEPSTFVMSLILMGCVGAGVWRTRRRKTLASKSP